MGKQNTKRVYVALSGGVDSSVAAALLKQAGFAVTGVFFKPWSPRPNFSKKNLGGQATGLLACTWKEDRLSAVRAAAALGIPFKTWDLSKEYKKAVADYMINSYRHGLTPNPDVMCNKEIKFGVVLKRALKEGADFIATGHYAKIQKLKIKNSFKLLKGRDRNKDQSYFLWTLNQKQLRHCLFPVGDLTKPEVRKLAKKFGLPNHARKDSQGVCFIGQLDMEKFLQNYIKPRAGKIIDQSGRVIGQHHGAAYYTIGQRHGLDIKNGQGPYFVYDKNLKSNKIFVTNSAKAVELFKSSALVKNISWVSSDTSFDIASRKIDAVIRYRSQPIPAKLIKQGANLLIKFKKPARAVTPGQSLVIYRGQELLGGGVIS